MKPPAESPAQPPVAARPPCAARGRLWGAIQSALWTGAVGVARPMWAARRAERLPWWSAWVVYWVAWWGLLAGLGTAEAWRIALPDAEPMELALLALSNLSLERWQPRDGYDRAAVLAQVVGVHLTPVTLGWLLLGWDGREEGRTAAVWRSTRRLWGAMPHVAAVEVTVTLAETAFDSAVQQAHNRVVSTTPAGYGPYGPIYAELPWWAEYSEVIWVTLVLVTWVWIVSALLCAVSVGGWSGRCRWPAACEGCGYNLAGLRPDGACPECGRARAESLSPGVRPGLRWLSRARWGLASVAGYVALAADAVLRPSAVGRAMRVFEPTAQHRWFLAVSSALLGAVQALGVCVMALAADWFSADDIFLAWCIGSIISGMVLLGWTFAASVFVGSTVGRGQRGGAAAACRGACYLSGLLVGYAGVVWWVTLTLELTDGRPLETVGEVLWMDPELVLLLLLAGMALAGVGLHLFALVRIVRAARHANR